MNIKCQIYYRSSYKYKTEKEAINAHYSPYFLVAIAKLVRWKEDQKLYWEYIAHYELENFTDEDLPQVHLEHEWVHWNENCHIPFEEWHLR